MAKALDKQINEPQYGTDLNDKCKSAYLSQQVQLLCNITSKQPEWVREIRGGGSWGSPPVQICVSMCSKEEVRKRISLFGDVTSQLNEKERTAYPFSMEALGRRYKAYFIQLQVPCGQKGNRCELHRGKNKERKLQSEDSWNMYRTYIHTYIGIGPHDVCDWLGTLILSSISYDQNGCEAKTIFCRLFLLARVAELI